MAGIKQSDPKKLLDRHAELVHSTDMKVSSHVQRAQGEWIVNTVMIEGYDVPFRFKRKKTYRNFKGARVNLTYYPDRLNVAGISMEVMNVVRIKLA